MLPGLIKQRDIHNTHVKLSRCTSWGYSRIIFTKYPSFCRTIFSTSPTNLMVLLPQAHNCSNYIGREILAPPPLCRNTLIYPHMTSHTLPTC